MSSSSQPVTLGLGGLTEGQAGVGLFLISHPVSAQGKRRILC